MTNHHNAWTLPSCLEREQCGHCFHWIAGACHPDEPPPRGWCREGKLAALTLWTHHAQGQSKVGHAGEHFCPDCNGTSVTP